MSPFDERFPDSAGSERLVLHIRDSGQPVPPGEYGFFEWYCEDPACDCRRALLQVISPQRLGEILATINYGWESEAFYTEWMHGDAEAGREITSASLDPLNPNSEVAEALLEAFRDHLRRDPAYARQLRRHYDLFKGSLSSAPGNPAVATPAPGMTADEILRQLRQVPDRCDFAPYEAALRAAAEQREAITPELIAALNSTSANPAHYLKQEGDWLHLFALYLLAQFRETRALEAFIRFFSLPGEDAKDLTGDMVTQHGAAVLASVCGGNPGPLLRLACDESVNEFVRGQAITGLLVQFAWGERPREAVIADLGGLFRTLRKPGDAYVWAELMCAVSDFNALELLPEVRQAYAEGLVDEGVIGLEEIDPAAPRGPDAYPRASHEKLFRWFCERNAPIDAVALCSGWICFRDEVAEANDWEDWEDGEDSPDEVAGSQWERPAIEAPPTPYIAPVKVGRNEACPCGSGKKYKKCCGK